MDWGVETSTQVPQEPSRQTDPPWHRRLARYLSKDNRHKDVEVDKASVAQGEKVC